MVEVIGATVAVDKYRRALSRVSTTTGLALSGEAKRYSRMSPRAISLAKSPPFPNRTGPPSLLGRLDSLCGRVVPVPGSRDFSGALGGPPESARNDSTSFAVPPSPWRAIAWNRGRPEWFPYVDSIPQSTPQPDVLAVFSVLSKPGLLPKVALCPPPKVRQSEKTALQGHPWRLCCGAQR